MNLEDSQENLRIMDIVCQDGLTLNVNIVDSVSKPLVPVTVIV